MARFYKTASVAPMDYMYQMNIPLMQQALQANELGVNQQIERAGQVGDLAAKFQYLTPDSQRAAEITKQYTEQVDAVSKAIQQDPMNWRKQKGSIRDLARNLQSNYMTGEISKIMGNYSKYKELDDYITKREEAGKVTPYEGAAFRAKALESLKDGTGYDPKTGTYKQISATKPMDTINVRERLEKMIEKKKASGELKWDEEAGKYIMKTTRGYEAIREQDLIPIMVQGLQGDTELMQYLRQRSDFGLMSGVFDKEGRFINPYVATPNPLNSVEKAQMLELQNKINSLRTSNPEEASKLQQQLNAMSAIASNRRKIEGNPLSSLYPTISSLAGEYSYEKIKEGTDMKNNSLYNMQVNNAFQGEQKRLDRNLRAAQFEQRMNQAQDFFNRRMEWDKYKWDNPQVKPTKATTKTTAKGKDGKPIENPVETMVGEVQVNPFHGVDYYSNEGISNTIKTARDQTIPALTRQVAQYDSSLSKVLNGRDYKDLTPDERGQYDKLMRSKLDLEDKLQDQSMTLDYARQLYTQADQWALHGKQGNKDNMSAQEIKLYQESMTNPSAFNRLKQQAEEYEKEKANLSVPDYAYQKPKQIEPAKQAVIDLYKATTGARERVAKLRDKFLVDNRENTPVFAPTAEFGTEDRKYVENVLNSANLRDLDLFDLKGRKGADALGELEGSGISWFNPTGDDYAPVFGGDRNLLNYLEKEGGKIKVMGISPSLGFEQGSKGGVLRIRFEKKDGGKGNVGDLPSDKDYFVTLNPQLQMKIGERLSTNKEGAVSDIGKLLLDGRNQAIRNAFLDVRNYTDPQSGELGVKKSVDIPYSGGTAKFNVRSYLNAEGDYDYYVTMTNRNGEEIPVRNPLSSIPGQDGFFDSIDHFQQAFDLNLKDNKFSSKD